MEREYAPLSFATTYAYSRKPGFHYGWDWAPRLVTCGIFKPVYLRAYDRARLDYPLLRNSKIQSETPDSVDIYGHVAVEVHEQG